MKTKSSSMVDVCKNNQVLSGHHLSKEAGSGDLGTRSLIMCP